MCIYFKIYIKYILFGYVYPPHPAIVHSILLWNEFILLREKLEQVL